MEEMKLDLNAPILSVRRFSSAASLNREDRNQVQNLSTHHNPPSYKSELQSGPIRNAGSIPFLWEQIPGKRKIVGEKSPRDLDIKPSAPNLPPGRILYGEQREQKQQHLEKHQQLSFTKSTEKGNTELVLYRESENLDIKSAGTSLENPSEELKNEKHCCLPKDDNDDKFLDANDTLSRSESFYMACSISDMSALDLQESKFKRRLSVDPEARELMMGRFLPAAKAMTSEASQYSSRRPATPWGIVRPTNRNEENKKPFISLSQPLVFSENHPDKEEEEIESNYEGYDAQDLVAKACGMLPRFCFKNSFGLLNPIPGMKGHSHMLLPRNSHKLIDQRKDPPNQSSNSESDGNSWDSVYKYKLSREPQLHSPLETESKTVSETFELRSRSLTPDGCSPHRPSSNDAVPFNERAIQPFSKEIGFLGVPVVVKVTRDDQVSHCKNHFSGLLNSESGSQRGSDLSSPTVEKTLYVDSVKALETPKSMSSSNTTEQITVYKDTVVSEDERLRGVSNVEEQLNMAIVAKDDNGDSFSGKLESLLPPPLPKSPSESWLWRTLPSVPSKATSYGPYTGIQTSQKRQALKPIASNPKWENMIKSSNNQHPYSRFAEKPKKLPPPNAEF